MGMDIALVGSLVGILTFVFSCFHYVVLKPLKESIVELRQLINKIQDNIVEEGRKRHEHDIKINTLEQQVHSLNDKFSILTKVCMETHGESILPLIAKLHAQD